MISMNEFSNKIAFVVFLAIAVAEHPQSVNAFLSGAPKLGGSNKVAPGLGSKPQLDLESRPVVEDAVERSCEVLYVGDAAVRGRSDGLCYDSNLTPLQARAIAVEAAVSKTVPKDTVMDALHCLTHSSHLALSGGANPAPVDAMDGVWRLCFADGPEFLKGIEHDRHGYVDGQQVDVRFDTLGNVFVLASQGLDASVPEILKGALAYSPSKQTVTGTFDKAVGMEPFVMQACLVDGCALGFHTVSKEGKNGFLLFHAERSRAAALRLQREASAPPAQIAAKKSAVASIAGKNKIVLPNDLKVMSEEASHEDKRMEVQERGNTVGSMNAWLRYLETEGPGLYAVIAGPVLFSFFKAYTPYAAAKASLAAFIISETIRQVMGVQT